MLSFDTQAGTNVTKQALLIDLISTAYKINTVIMHVINNKCLNNTGKSQALIRIEEQFSQIFSRLFRDQMQD